MESIAASISAVVSFYGVEFHTMLSYLPWHSDTKLGHDEVQQQASHCA